MANSIELIADFGKKLSNDPFITIRYLLITLLFFLGIGVLFIWWKNDNIHSSVSFIFSALASCAVGVFLGFLFGVPKSSKGEGSSEIFNIKEPYSENSNLVEVSDWLTKIIIGLSLTQWQYLMAQLHFGSGLIANAIAMNEGNSADNLMAFGYGTILFFLTTGFILGYIYTRTIFFRILLTLRLDNVVAQQQMVSYKKSLASQVTQEEVEKSVVSTSGNVMRFKTFVETLAKEDEKGELQKLSEILPPIAAVKPIDVPEDLQKGRWGGKSVRDGFKLDANVVPSSEYSGLFKVTLRVIQVDGSPVNHPAAFLVHDSFKLENNVIYASMDGTGNPQTSLTAYESFTVGAFLIIGDKQIELELDLSKMKNLPKGFV